MDPRCLEGDHHFSDEDLYDWDGRPLENQWGAKCVRCGTTLEESLFALREELKRALDGTLVN